MLKFRKIVIFILVVQLIIQLFSLNEGDYYGNRFLENSFKYTWFNTNDSQHNNFENYYHISFFEQFKDKYQNSEKTQFVACVDLPSAIFDFNQFNTLGGYFAYFPKSYLKEYASFFNLKESELNVTRKIEVKSEMVNNERFINLNIEALRTKNCKYLFSKFKLNSNVNLFLEEVIVNKNKNQFIKKLYIYKI